MLTKRTFLAALSLPVFLKNAWAQGWPSQLIRLITPWPAGGNGDALARALSMKLGPVLGQSVLVDNLPGAGGSIGIATAARAPADGYTVIEVSAAAAINATLYPKLSFDLTRDFVPICIGATLPLILVVNASLPVNSVQELIAYAKAHPGKLNYASSGSGTGGHLAAELFKSLAGIQMTHVPYKGASPAVTDLIGGQTQLFFDGIPSSMPHVKSGKLKLLAVTTSTRFVGLPDVPTVAEAGLPGLEASVWFGFMAPVGTDPKIIARLNTEINRALDTADMKERLVQVGFQPLPPTTPAEFGAYIKSEISRWAAVIKSSGAHAE